MRPVLHDVRRARLRRGPLVAITGASLAGLLVAALVPALAPWLGPAWPVLMVLAGAAFVGACVAYVAARRGVRSAADDVAWVVALGALAICAGATREPVSLHFALFAAALTALALRDPSGSLVVIACATTALAPVVRMLLVPRPEAVVPLALATLVAAMGFVATLVQTRRLARVLSQRDAALAERERPARPAGSHAPPVPPPAPLRAAPTTRTAGAGDDARKTGSHDAGEPGWDALVERVRTSVTTIAESAGVMASVQAELSGLAPPSNKIRVHLVRIVQEAAAQALRHADPRSIIVTLRRGEGGVVFELQDDGAASESTRNKRALATLRGRVAALGGTAEMRRADRGWVMRVRLPCEQLN